MEDIILVCQDCGQQFVFSVEEQEFFIEKGFRNKPSRCMNCRKKVREAREAQSMKEMLATPERFEVRCRNCGRVYLTYYKDRLPDVAKICMLCVPADFNRELFFGGVNLTVNKTLGYPKFKG